MALKECRLPGVRHQGMLDRAGFPLGGSLGTGSDPAVAPVAPVEFEDEFTEEVRRRFFITLHGEEFGDPGMGDGSHHGEAEWKFESM